MELEKVYIVVDENDRHSLSSSGVFLTLEAAEKRRDELTSKTMHMRHYWTVRESYLDLQAESVDTLQGLRRKVSEEIVLKELEKQGA